METKYIPGDALAFKAYIDAHCETKTVELRSIDGHARWIVTEDGIETIVRPEEARSHE